MNGMMNSLAATKYRMTQYDTFRNAEKCVYLRKQIISAKQQSQLKLKLIGSDVDVIFLFFLQAIFLLSCVPALQAPLILQLMLLQALLPQMWKD